MNKLIVTDYGMRPVGEFRLERLSRSELKAYIRERKLPVKVYKKMGDATLRKVICEVEIKCEKEEAGLLDRHDVMNEVKRQRIRKTAERLVREAEHAEDPNAFTLPPPGSSVADELARAPEAAAYTINDLHHTGGNTVFTASFKSGKTTTLLNVVKCLCDGEPFLGCFPTKLPYGKRVAFQNHEMVEDQFLRWLRETDIQNLDRLAPILHLRGRRFPIWESAFRDEYVAWLVEFDVGLIVVDPLSRAWRGLAESENDGEQVGKYLTAFDECKRLAGVADGIPAHHTGRIAQGDGQDRSRGHTVIDDWKDAGWMLEKDKDKNRVFRAEGRDVDVEPLALAFDVDTRAVTFTGQTRKERETDVGCMKALQPLADMLHANDPAYPPNTTAWRTAIGSKTEDCNKWMDECKKARYINVTGGLNKSKLIHLNKRGGRALKRWEQVTA